MYNKGNKIKLIVSHYILKLCPRYKSMGVEMSFNFRSFYTGYFCFKIARLDSSQNFMDMAKTIDLTRLCIQSNNI